MAGKVKIQKITVKGKKIKIVWVLNVEDSPKIKQIKSIFFSFLSSPSMYLMVSRRNRGNIIYMKR